MDLNTEKYLDEHKHAARALQDLCFSIAATSGWWNDLATGQSLATVPGEKPKINVPEKLCLIHSEISEGMEGFRKGLMDDKLPNRTMLEVELADAIIRAFDLAGGIGLDVGGAIIDKLVYNSSRQDHKPENRKKEGGKAF